MDPAEDMPVRPRAAAAGRGAAGLATAGPPETAAPACQPGERKPAARAEGRAEGRAGPGRGLFGLASLLDRPLTSYYLILGSATLLLALGLVMVLSTSSVQQLDAGAS